MAKPKEIWKPWPGAQKRFLGCPVWEVLLHGNRGGGKAGTLTSGILTPKGWKIMGDMKIGSRICNPDGTTQTVIGVYPQGSQVTYKVTFEDGGSTYVNNEHLWLARIANRSWSPQEDNIEVPLGFKKGRIFTTQQLMDIMKKYPHKKPLIPVLKKVKFTHQNTFKYDIDPYLLGLLLGDGCFSRKNRVSFTTVDEELAEYVKQYEFEKVPSCEIDYRVTSTSEVYKEVVAMGLQGTLSHTKFIPKRYLFGKEDERLSLLQGLMDTDGYVDEEGHSAMYTTVSSQLMKDVRFLVQSLGGRCSFRSYTGKYKKNGKYIKCKTAWDTRIVFPNTGDLFRLKRKKIRGEGRTYQHGYIARKIVSITLNRIESCQCIKVNHPNGLYITDDCIVTHNTDVLIMDYLQEVGVGHGIDYKGLLLREATTELGDVITKTKKWIPRIFPSAKFNNQKKIWTFEGGETLWLNYARVLDDYEQYHGHEYPWIGWEEITNHPFDKVYKKMMSCNRSSNPNIPRKYRATCNSSGPGHQWVKDRFINKTKAEKVYCDEFGQTRTHIQSFLFENKSLLEADPNYKAKLMAMTEGDKLLRDAWVYGSWDLIAGGFFTDVWDKKIHVMDSFRVPRSWNLLRSFDWGSSKPWAVTYGFEANGEQPHPSVLGGRTIPYIPRGSVIIPTELYGWNGTVNEGDQATSQQIAKRVLSVDNTLHTHYNVQCVPGPADTSIWEVRDGTSIGANLTTHGCNWTKAYKGSGSRIAGWAIIRQMLNAAKTGDLESPHLYFFEQAEHHIRTLPIMQRDKKKPEDVDTDLEDHCMDSLRYLLARKLTTMKRRKVRN